MPTSSEHSDAADAQPLVATPRLGWVTAVWLLLLTSAVFGLAPDRDQLLDLMSGQVWQGLMWGSASVAVWMLASPPATCRRRLLCVFVLTTLFGWFHHCSGRPLSRYVISIGSFALLQLAAASILGWPGWSLGKQSLHAVHRYRFGIASVMLLTAAIAVVLAATRSYEAPEEFFHGSRASAVGMVMTALAVQMSMLSRRHATPWAVATLVSLSLTIAMLGTLHALEVNHRQPSEQAATSLRDLFDAASWAYYLPPLFSFTATVAVTSLCGRLDHEIEQTRRRSRVNLSFAPPPTASR